MLRRDGVANVSPGNNSYSRRSFLKVGVVGSPVLTAGCLRLSRTEEPTEDTAETPTETAAESGTTSNTSSVSESTTQSTSETDDGTTTSTESTVQDPTGSVVLTEQETDGTFVSVAEVETDVEAIIQVYDASGNFLANPGIRFEAGDTRNNVRIDLESPLSETTELTVKLFWCEESGPNTCNGPSIATDTATLSVTEPSTTQTTTASPTGSVVLNDQETDGSYVTVSEVQTSAEAIIQVYDANGEFLANPGIRFESGETRTDLKIRIEPSLSNTQEVTVRLFWCEESGPNTCNGPAIAEASATLSIK